MGLEDLTGSNKFIDALVSSNPASTDTRREGDDHLRGIKNVLGNTFPNIDGEVSVTEDELNYLSGVTANIQTSLTSLTSDIADHETRISTLESAGGNDLGYAARKNTHTSAVALHNQSTWVEITGLTRTVPTSWTTGSVKVTASINVVMEDATPSASFDNAVFGFADLGVFVNGTLRQSQLVSAGLLVQAEPNSAGLSINFGFYVPLDLIVSAVAGDSISVRAKQTDPANPPDSLYISYNGRTSYVNYSPVDLTV